MLSQKFILNYVSKIVILILQLFATIIIARFAGAVVLGHITFTLAYASAFWFIADLGLGTAHIKYISESTDPADNIKTFIILKCCLIAAYIIFIIAFFIIQKYVFNIDFGSKEVELLIFMSMGIVVVQQLVLIPNTTFMGKVEQAKQDIPTLIQNIFLQVSRIILVLVGLGAFYLVLGHFVAVLIGAVLSFYLFRNYPIGTFRKDIVKKYLKISLPVLSVMVIIVLMQNIDKVILQFSTNSAEVGKYAVGYRFGGFILSISDTVNLLLFPLFTAAFIRNDHTFIIEKVKKYERLCLAFGLPVVIFILLLSKDILLLLVGKQYIDAVPTMQILLLSSFLMLLSIPFYNILNGKGLFKLTSKLYFIGFILFLFFSVILVSPFYHNFGATGMAICLLINNFFLFIMFRIKAFELIDYDKKLIFIPYFMISIFVYLIHLPIMYYFHLSSLLNLVLSSLLLCLQLLLFYFFNLIGKKDFTYMQSILKINLLFNYMRTEINSSSKNKK